MVEVRGGGDRERGLEFEVPFASVVNTIFNVQILSISPVPFTQQLSFTLTIFPSNPYDYNNNNYYCYYSLCTVLGTDFTRQENNLLL